MGDTGNCGTELNFYFILFHAARRTKFLFTPPFLPLLLFWRRGFPETHVMCVFVHLKNVNCKM